MYVPNFILLYIESKLPICDFVVLFFQEDRWSWGFIEDDVNTTKAPKFPIQVCNYRFTYRLSYYM